MRTRLSLSILILGLGILWAVGAAAQAPPPLTAAGLSSQFDLVGFLEEATLTTPGDVLSGGTLTVNGHLVIVPRNILVAFPAAFLTWEQIFSQAPAPYGPDQTGMALSDFPPPISTYEVHVVGNRVGNANIAALIDFSQQSLNSGQGLINFIDYTLGEMRVGGLIGDPTSGARVQINDPGGRYGLAHSPDPRFTVDDQNPTIRSETGYPMCLPRSAPPAIDAACPIKNRPLVNPAIPGVYSTFFTFPPAPPANPDSPDSRQQMPFVVGDYITFAGTLVQDPPSPPTEGPFPPNGAPSTYISAHTIVANVGAYTAPGNDPAYVAIDVTLLGAGGVIDAAGVALEAGKRTRFEGFTTDPTRIIELDGIDVGTDASCTAGQESLRFWGTIDADPGPPAGAVAGRWRFRPPDKVLSITPVPLVFLPVTREVMARIPGANHAVVANGLTPGQYRAPITEFVLIENRPGFPVPQTNFEDFPFLRNGGYVAPGTSVPMGMLDPFPTFPVPNTLLAIPGTACTRANVPQLPIAIAGPNQTVTSAATVALNGSASFDPAGTALTFAWTAPAGVTLSSTTAANPTFIAPVVPPNTLPVTLTFSLVVTNASLVASAPSTVSITVNPPGPIPLPPNAQAGAVQNVASPPPAATVTLDGGGSTDPQGSLLTFQWTQVAGPGVALSSVPGNPAQVTFSVPAVASGQAPVTLTFNLAVTNGFGLTSTDVTAVIVIPQPDTVTITAATFLRGTATWSITGRGSVPGNTIAVNLGGGGPIGTAIVGRTGAWRLLLRGSSVIPPAGGVVNAVSSGRGSSSRPVLIR